MKIFNTLGPFLVGSYFVFFGIWNACHFHATASAMKNKKVPFANFTLTLGIFLQTLAGSALMCGVYTKIAALLLIPFTLSAIFMFHAFWLDKKKTRTLNMIIFITNLTATLGALCLIIKG